MTVTPTLNTSSTKQAALGTFTVTIASPAVFSYTAHGLSAGDKVVFATTSALPTGLTAGTTYFVIAAGLTANAFEVSATVGGSAVNTSGSQSGTQSVISEVFTSAALSSGVFKQVVDVSNMAAGDLTEIRWYKKVLSGGAEVLADMWALVGAQTAQTVETPFISVDSGGSCRFSIRQTLGTSRAYPNAILTL